MEGLQLRAWATKCLTGGPGRRTQLDQGCWQAVVSHFLSLIRSQSSKASRVLIYLSSSCLESRYNCWKSSSHLVTVSLNFMYGALRSRKRLSPQRRSLATARALVALSHDFISASQRKASLSLSRLSHCTLGFISFDELLLCPPHPTLF